MKEKSSTTQLASPAEAALYLEKLITESGWGIINVTLGELTQFIPYFQSGWDRKFAADFTQLLINCKNKIGSTSDMITSLSVESFIIITRKKYLQVWQDELDNGFTSLVSERIPNTLFNGRNVILIADEIFPVPSLVFGIVTSEDGPFLQPVGIYHTLITDKKKNERSDLWFTLNSLFFTRSRLTEKLLCAKHNRDLYSRVSAFSTITTGYLHDIRNGLNLLFEQSVLDMNKSQNNNQGLPIPQEKTREIQNTNQYILFLLEIISEIRFRGTGIPEKTDIHRLILEKIDSFQSGINHTLTFADIDQTVVVFTKPRQIMISLFTLLLLLKMIVKDGNPIHIGCGISEKNGFIQVKGDFRVDIDTIISIKAMYEMDEYWPYVYVFKKIISRLQGSLEVNLHSIFIFLPLYEYQDQLSLHTIRKQIRKAESEINTIKSELQKEPAEDTIPAAIAMKLAGTLFHTLYESLQKFTQLVKEINSAFPGDIPEMLLAGSRYCMLLTANLFSLEGMYIKETEKTDVKKVLTVVKTILHYRLIQATEYELSYPDSIPCVHATETALAQVIINCVLNSVEELVRVKPAIPRLSISVKEKNDRVIISINDAGAGIPDEIIQWVMNTASKNHKGMTEYTGLLVVKSILDQCGAEMEITVYPDKGTTIYIRLRKWEEN